MKSDLEYEQYDGNYLCKRFVVSEGVVFNIWRFDALLKVSFG